MFRRRNQREKLVGRRKRLDGSHLPGADAGPPGLGHKFLQRKDLLRVLVLNV